LPPRSLIIATHAASAESRCVTARLIEAVTDSFHHVAADAKLTQGRRLKIDGWVSIRTYKSFRPKQSHSGVNLG
jgi:hypothetical protein